MALKTFISKVASNLLTPHALPAVSSFRFRHMKAIPTPEAGKHNKQYWRIVHYPEDRVYSVKPLEVTNLAGRDPITGRVAAKGIGGGIKHKFHWVQYKRDGPTEGPPREERVIEVLFDGHRTAKIALIGCGDELKYIIATENMKAGDIIKSSRVIPRIPVRANEGDAYPLGALQIGTRVHCIEQYPGRLNHTIRAAGTFGTIVRKFEGHVVVQDTKKHEIAFKENCMATVGRVSNILHSSTPVGSIQNKRALGYRPRSGLWQRKTGRHGRKIRPLPPMRFAEPAKKRGEKAVVMNLPDFRYKH